MDRELLSQRMGFRAVDYAASYGKIHVRHKLDASAQACLQHTPQIRPGVEIFSDLVRISEYSTVSTEAEVARLSVEGAM